MDLKICRICLSKTATIYIFDKQDDIQYSAKLMHCVSIVISEDDGFPDNICTCCAEELNVVYKFVIKCEDSDKTLRDTNLSHVYNHYNDNVLKQESKIKLEDLEEESAREDFAVEDNDGLDLCLLDDVKSCDKYERKKRRKKYKKIEKFGIKIDGRKLRQKKGPIACSVCSLVKPSASALETHMRTHTGEKPFMCHSCDARYAIKGSLKRHMLTNHTERKKLFICETCGQSFMSKNCIIIHMRLHTGEKPYTCPFCPKTFRQLASQIRHKRTHTGDRPYSCHICFKKFLDKSQLRRHETVHSDKRNFNCHVCNKAVKSKNSLMNHIKTHSNEKHNVCNYCGSAFTTKGNLQAHIQRKHSEKSGVCDICLKQFSDLEAHMPRHTGEKLVTCKLCNQAFLNKRSLSNHMAFKHNNASKYKCSVGECRKTFPIVPMLEFHLLKYHKNGTPFTCKHCSRGFYRKSDLSRHLRVNHMDVIKKS